MGHSYVFLGLEEPIFLSIFKIGPLGVVIFFIISGYLIAASWNSDSNLLRYFIRRSLRIFPALIVFTIVAVFILGPLATNLSVREYFSHHLTFYYFSNIFLYINYYLPGVFEKARFVNAVNGSLWSLTIEFFMYTSLAVLSFLVLARLRKFIYLVLYIVSILISIF